MNHEKHESVTRQLVESCQEPKRAPECSEHFKRHMGAHIHKAHERGLLLRSEPVKIQRRTSTFYVAKGKYHTITINGERKTLRFYTKEAWDKNFGKRIDRDKVLEFIKDRKAVTCRDVIKEFNLNPSSASFLLGKFVRDGKLYRRGLLNRYGVEVPIRGIGYVYGTDPLLCASMVEELAQSDKVAPSFVKVLRRIDEDSRIGRVTSLETFRKPPFKLPAPTLTYAVHKISEMKQYSVRKYGRRVFIYNNQLLAVEDADRQLKAIFKAVEEAWNIKWIKGLALEEIIRQGLVMLLKPDKWGQGFSSSKNPYGSQVDLVLIRKSDIPAQEQPDVNIFEVKFRVVTKEAVQHFYNTVKHAENLGSKQLGAISVSSKISYDLAKSIPIPIHDIKTYVRLFIVGCDASKEAFQLMARYGITFIFASELLKVISKKLRRKITLHKIERELKNALEADEFDTSRPAIKQIVDWVKRKYFSR